MNTSKHVVRAGFVAPATLLLTATLLPTAALAYVGPGAGLSLIGALWGLVVAVVLALAFIVAWPVRRMLRRRREQAAPSTRDEDAARQGASVGSSPT